MRRQGDILSIDSEGRIITAIVMVLLVLGFLYAVPKCSCQLETRWATVGSDGGHD